MGLAEAVRYNKRARGPRPHRAVETGDRRRAAARAESVARVDVAGPALIACWSSDALTMSHRMNHAGWGNWSTCPTVHHTAPEDSWAPSRLRPSHEQSSTRPIDQHEDRPERVVRGIAVGGPEALHPTRLLRRRARCPPSFRAGDHALPHHESRSAVISPAVALGSAPQRSTPQPSIFLSPPVTATGNAATRHQQPTPRSCVNPGVEEPNPKPAPRSAPSRRIEQWIAHQPW